MLSNHYGWLYNHPRNWLVLILMMFAGAAIRQFFVRHGFRRLQRPCLAPMRTVGVIGATGRAGLAQARTAGAVTGAGRRSMAPPRWQQLHAVVSTA